MMQVILPHLLEALLQLVFGFPVNGSSVAVGKEKK